MTNGQERIGDAGLRMALRGLRREATPSHELWPGIAERIAALPRQPHPVAAAPRQRHWAWPVATAASLLLAVGVVGKLRLDQTAVAPASASVAQAGTSRASLVRREVDSMTVQYQAALRELDPHAIPAGWQPGLEALDRSAAEIRDALDKNPGSRLLLQQLRTTYTRRLALSRRALYA